ncbi:hypothetical protein CBS470a_005173 [Colletotrichum nupharicola]|nr:hypothetical protein CBS470a_005173 [Colletotrichum nupharicola]
MALHWSRRNVEQCLPPELFAALSSAHTNPWHEPSHDEAQSLPVVDGKTGEVLIAAKVDDGRRVVRRKLRDLFRRGIDVRFGYKLAGVDTSGGGVTATFETGEVVCVDVLVGADGVADVPDPEDPETWEFQVALSLWSTEDPPETNEDRIKYFKKLAEPYCEPYRSAALTPETWSRPSRRSKRGRQTLAAAIDEYDAEVYQRGKREIEISEESMFGLHHYSAIKGSPINRMGLKEQKA